MRVILVLVLAVAAVSAISAAQWLHYPTEGVP